MIESQGDVLQEFLRAVESATGYAPRETPNGWMARCPAHDDRDPSLSINHGDRQPVVVKCFAGCTEEEICAAVGGTPAMLCGDNENGNGRSSWTPPRNHKTKPQPTTYPSYEEARDACDKTLAKSKGKRVAEREYQDADGAAYAYVLRYDLPTPAGEKQEKTFRPISKRGDSWVTLDPVDKWGLYNLPELNGANRVYIVEGEGKVESLRSIGLSATASAHGSQSPHKSDWAALVGKECVIWPDNDDPGREYARDVAQILFELDNTATIRILSPTGRQGSGDDVVDFIELHDSLDEEAQRGRIEAMADVAPEAKPAAFGKAQSTENAIDTDIVNLADVQPEKQDWLWQKRIPLGKLTILAGDPGLGKSLICLDIAARVSSAKDWPDGSVCDSDAGGVVLLTAEDGLADTVKPRLIAAGANDSMICAIKSVTAKDKDGTYKRMLDLKRDVDRVERAIQTIGNCRLVIIDPISAYLGDTDSHNNSSVRAVLAPLADLAERRRVAILAVTHLNKGEGRAMYRATGSVAFTATARAFWAVGPDKENPPDGRSFAPGKNNLAKMPGGLNYSIVGVKIVDLEDEIGVVAWSQGEVAITADDLLGEQVATTDALLDAKEWLSDWLANGPKPGKETEEAASKAEIKPRTLRRAKRALDVRSFRSGFQGPTNWELAGPRTWVHGSDP